MNGLSLGLGAVEAEFWRMAFVMTRLGAAFLAAPLFGAAAVPPQARVALAGAMAVLVCAWTPVAAPAALLSLAGLMAVAGEVLVGLALGFVLQLCFAGPAIAAEMIGGTMGMAMATAVDPNHGTQAPVFGQYFASMLTLVFLGLGAHLQWIGLLVESYRAFPPGEAWLGEERLGLLLGFAGDVFATGVAIALPVTMVLLLVQVVTGVLSRSAPALNLFALGLPAGVLAGLAALLMAAPVLGDQLATASATAIDNAGRMIGR